MRASRTRISLIAGIAVLSSLAPGPASAASPRFKALGPITSPASVQPVVTDGGRFAALQPNGGISRIVDTQRGRSYDVPTPGEGCSVTAAGAGQIVWSCPEARGAIPILLDARTRRLRRLPGVEAFLTEVEALRSRYDGDPASVRFAAVGRRWIEGRVEFTYQGSKTFSFYRTVHLDRLTGERRSDAPGSARSFPDLDRPGLTRRLCRPLSRTPGDNPSGNAPAFEPFTFESGVALDVDPSEPRLLLKRCGRRPLVLSRCRRSSGCYSEQLGAGVLTWAERRTAHAYGISSGHRRTLAPAAARRGGPTTGCGPLAVAHTRTRVFVSVASGPPDTEARCGWRVYASRMPR